MKKVVVLSKAYMDDGRGVVVLDYEKSSGFRLPSKNGLLQNAFATNDFGKSLSRLNVPPNSKGKSYIVNTWIENDVFFVSDFDANIYKINFNALRAVYVRNLQKM